MHIAKERWDAQIFRLFFVRAPPLICPLPWLTNKTRMDLLCRPRALSTPFSFNMMCGFALSLRIFCAPSPSLIFRRCASSRSEWVHPFFSQRARLVFFNPGVYCIRSVSLRVTTCGSGDSCLIHSPPLSSLLMATTQPASKRGFSFLPQLLVVCPHSNRTVRTQREWLHGRDWVENPCSHLFLSRLHNELFGKSYFWRWVAWEQITSMF